MPLKERLTPGRVPSEFDKFADTYADPRLSLLDVGCGKGDFLKVSVSSFRQRAGCDPSEKMLRKLDSASISLRLQQSSTEIPYDSSEFDVLTAICVFHYVPSEVRHKLCMEMHRVLRPNGVMCLIGHNPFNQVARGRAQAPSLTAGSASNLDD